MREAPTFTAQIYMAGDMLAAKQICQEYCEIGLCVTIEPLDFIYTGGKEAGFRVGLINYPKFPATSDRIKEIAIDLANTLRNRLYQDSYSIVCSDTTIWESRREQTTKGSDKPCP